ncbi:MAG: hypothetical protein IJU70_02900 [Lentisphaeria bacterium]|nr:hypothetical protein [Lentisphaeria bacterium]
MAGIQGVKSAECPQKTGRPEVSERPDVRFAGLPAVIETQESDQTDQCHQSCGSEADDVFPVFFEKFPDVHDVISVCNCFESAALLCFSNRLLTGETANVPVLLRRHGGPVPCLCGE